MSEKMIVMVDIDGTIADNRWRINKPNGFDDEMIIQDQPYTVMRSLVWGLAEYAQVVYATGRMNMHRKTTLQWLDMHRFPLYPEVDTLLFMRPDGNRNPNEQVKNEFYKSLIQNGKVVLAIDDDNDVLQMFIHRNVPVIDAHTINQFEQGG